MIRCPHCGAQNREDAAFCTLCLTRFDQPAEPEVTGAPAAEPGPDAGTHASAEPPPAAEQPLSSPSSEEERAWSEAAGAFSAPQAQPGDDVPAELADLPPELQMELMRPSSSLDMRKLWMRASIVIALAVVSIALSVGILAMLINQRISRPADQQSQQQAAPQAAIPAQPQPAPAPAGPESHPDLGFSVPSGWSSGGTADNIALTGPNGESIEIKSWERGPDGRYNFTNGQLGATSEAAAVSEMRGPLLQTLYGGSVPATAAASPASAGSVGATMAELRGGQGQMYRRAYGFAHGNWAYMALGSAPSTQESALASDMQSLLGSVTFKQ